MLVKFTLTFTMSLTYPQDSNFSNHKYAQILTDIIRKPLPPKISPIQSLSMLFNVLFERIKGCKNTLDLEIVLPGCDVMWCVMCDAGTVHCAGTSGLPLTTGSPNLMVISHKVTPWIVTFFVVSTRCNTMGKREVTEISQNSHKVKQIHS